MDSVRTKSCASCVLSCQGLSPRAASTINAVAPATTTTLVDSASAATTKTEFENARRALAHRQRQDKLQRQAQRLQQQQKQLLLQPQEKKAKSTRSVGTQGELNTRSIASVQYFVHRRW